MDLTLIAIFKRTFAVEFFPNVGWAEASQPGSGLSPFGSAIVLSLGYIIVLMLTIPLGYFNLDNNIIVQVRMHGSVFQFCHVAA